MALQDEIDALEKQTAILASQMDVMRKQRRQKAAELDGKLKAQAAIEKAQKLADDDSSRANRHGLERVEEIDISPKVEANHVGGDEHEHDTKGRARHDLREPRRFFAPTG